MSTGQIKLSAENEAYLKAIWTPVTVAVPPDDATRGMCQMPDGEIRVYGTAAMPDDSPKRCYIASRDYGLNWVRHYVSDDNELGPMVWNPYAGEWISTLSQSNYHCTMPAIKDMPKGSYAILSKGGPGTTEKEVIEIPTGRDYLDMRLPIVLRSRKRVVFTTQKWHNGSLTPVVLRTDDNGHTWQESILQTVPPHEMKPPHRGVRWQQYSCEPTLIELNSGRLMLVSRTSQDFHYIYYSDDAGETWTAPVPSDCFHACTTMPLLKRMSDGRLLFFWCNTQPLPELDHANEQWGLSEAEIHGVWEDVFTNRDANHAAISTDDGKTWRGFREIALNAIRNRVDFRSVDPGFHLDKSVHQFEAMELPHGKILLSFGQAPASRRMVIFDPDWLLETGRKEDFMLGLENISTHVYLKSISGGRRTPYMGHCSWNRTHGAVLVPDPAHNFAEVVQLVTPNDPRLFNHTQGVVWNFPAMRKGTVKLSLHICGEPIRLSLTDRWFNPCDESVPQVVQFTTTLSKNQCADNAWTQCEIRFDLDAKVATLYLDGKEHAALSINGNAPAGFSYLLIQTTASTTDFKGTLLQSMEAEATLPE